MSKVVTTHSMPTPTTDEIEVHFNQMTAFAQMTPAEKQTFLAGLPDEERRFTKGCHNDALTAGFLDPIAHGGPYPISETDKVRAR
jgi:hypothetical protein